MSYFFPRHWWLPHAYSHSLHVRRQCVACLCPVKKSSILLAHTPKHPRSPFPFPVHLCPSGAPATHSVRAPWRGTALHLQQHSPNNAGPHSRPLACTLTCVPRAHTHTITTHALLDTGGLMAGPVTSTAWIEIPNARARVAPALIPHHHRCAEFVLPCLSTAPGCD